MFGPNVLMESRASPHSFFPAGLDEPAVRRVRRQESKGHSNLHHEPVASLRGRKMWIGKEDKVGQGHPAEESDLEGENGKRIGLDRRNQPVAQGEMAHWRNNEVLKRN